MSIKMYNKDCLLGMKEMKDKSVDLIISDYPFNCQDGRKDYNSFVKETADEYYRVLKDDGNLIVINNPINIFETTSYFQKFNLRNGVALIRKGALRAAWMLGFQHNYMWILHKADSKKVKWNGTKKNHDKSFLTDVIQYQNGYRGKGKDWHPQAIPLDLTETLVSLLSNEGDIVLDPFIGSGTTPVACKRLNRNMIGFELNKKYYDMALKRYESS